MNSDDVTLCVPDALGGGVGDVEALHALVDSRLPAERFVLDMRRVGFVKPYGVVALLLVTRRLAGLSGRRVELANVDRSTAPSFDITADVTRCNTQQAGEKKTP